jgi:cysteine desulfurase/selenocysteine lyase
MPPQVPSDGDLRSLPALGGGLAGRTSSVQNGMPSFGGLPPGTFGFLDQAAKGANVGAPVSAALPGVEQPAKPSPAAPNTSLLGGPSVVPDATSPSSSGPRPPYVGAGAMPPQVPSDGDLRSLPALGGGLAGRTSSVQNGLPSFGGLPPGTFGFLDQAAKGPSVGAPASAALPGVEQPAKPAPASPSTSLLGFQGFDFSPSVVPDATSSTSALNVGLARRDFPVLKERVDGNPLVWLDNAATTQKPQSVIDRLSYFYEHENSNVHRGMPHTLASRATDAYEGARDKVRRFLNASSTKEIVFTRGTTEAINLVAQSWGRRYVEKGDEVVITWLEHHSNIVPWQQLCSEKGAKLKVAPVDDDGQIILSEYEKLFTSRTKIASLSQVSNALGTITPAKDMVEIAHRFGAKVLVDGAQAVSHMSVDVQSLDCDFYVFSGHKVFGPTGIGVLRGKEEVLNSMPPWQGGGNMIADVTFEKTVYHPAPWRFEAGTGNIADAVGLGAAIDYVQRIGMDNIGQYEHGLLEYGTECLLTIPGLRIIGTAKEKAGVMSFVINGHKVEEIGQALAAEGIAVRAGHHCAQPALRRFGLEGTVRPSLALYNDQSDIDALIEALRRITAGRKYG